jgi:hypothetical protein
MENLNHLSIQLPPLSNRLKSDTIRHDKFINHPNLTLYKREAFEAFFGFLDSISVLGPDKQFDALELPSEVGSKNIFGIYNDIFDAFLSIYWDVVEHGDYNTITNNKQYQKKMGFELYQNILFKSEIDFIKKTQQEIADLSDPNIIYQHYESYLKKYDVTFDEQCDFIGQQIWHDTRILWTNSWLSITDIIDTLADLSDENKEWHPLFVHNTYFKPFLLKNIQICQDFIAMKDIEESQEEEKNDVINVYNQIIEHLQKQDQPIKLNINQTLRFTLPICTQLDFEKYYNHFMSVVWARWNFPILWYSTNIKYKPWEIHNIEYKFTDSKDKEISISDYLEYQLAIDDWREAWSEDDDLEDDLEDDPQTWYQSYLKIINKTTQALPRYYKMEIYLSIDDVSGFPCFTIQVDEYVNQFDQEWNWINSIKKPKSIITKPTFYILDNDRNADEYMQDFVNFMDRLSSDYDCLNMLWITQKNL